MFKFRRAIRGTLRRLNNKRVKQLSHKKGWMEQDFTMDYLARAIDEFKVKKYPRKDGLLVELFKTFKGILIGPLLNVWK